MTIPDRLSWVEKYMRQHQTADFRSLLEAQCSKVQIIVTFLAVLELMKMGKIQVEQEDTFGEIRMKSCMENKESEDEDDN